MEAYFDNSATTKVFDCVRDIVVKTMTEDYGNPSARHKKGMEAEQYVRRAASQIAKTLRVQEKEILFTSGGTESNNMALIGAAMANRRAGNHLITTRIEHASVYNPMAFLEQQGFEVTYLKVDGEGHISLKELEESIRRQQLLLRRSQEYRRSIARISDHLGRCSFDRRPACIYYINRHNQEFDTAPDLGRVTRQWLKYLPFSRRSFIVPMEALLSPDSREEFQWGFSLSQEYAGLLGASAQPPVVALSDTRCVYTVFSNPDSAFSPRFFGYAMDFIRAQGLRLCGDVFGNLLVSANEAGPLAITPGTPQITGYFEAWLPVTDA